MFYIRDRFDIALLSSEESLSPSRADFLDGTPLNSVEGYWALKQGKIPVRTLSDSAPWHLSLAPMIGRMDGDLIMNGSVDAELLDPYTVTDPEGDARPSLALQRETEARNQLASRQLHKLQSYRPSVLHQRHYCRRHKLWKEKTQSDASRKHELEKETKLWGGPRLAALESVTR